MNVVDDVIEPLCDDDDDDFDFKYDLGNIFTSIGRTKMMT